MHENNKKSKEQALGVQAVKKKPDPKPYTPQYGIIILCDGESHQENVYNILKQEGYKCRIVTT